MLPHGETLGNGVADYLTALKAATGVATWGDARQRCCRLLDGTEGSNGDNARAAMETARGDGNGSCRIGETLGNGVADYLTARRALGPSVLLSFCPFCFSVLRSKSRKW